MRKMLAVAAILGLAALPAWADRGTTVSLSGRTVQTGHTYNAVTGQLQPGAPASRFVGAIYQDGAVASVWPMGSGAAYPAPSGDDIHAIAGGTMTSFTFGYFAPSSLNTAPLLGVTFRFYNITNLATDGPIPPYPPAGAFATVAVSVPSLPNYVTTSGSFLGLSAVAVTGLAIPVGTDFWIEQDWRFGGAYYAGPIVTGNSGGTVGYSHDLFSQTGSLWGLGAWADFFYGVNVIPEPATISLVALAGLVVLRRRR